MPYIAPPFFCNSCISKSHISSIHSAQAIQHTHIHDKVLELIHILIHIPTCSLTCIILFPFLSNHQKWCVNPLNGDYNYELMKDKL